MIKDNINNARIYAGISPRIAQALEFAAHGGFEGLEPGRYDIDGDNVYVIIQHNELKDWDEGKWEAHRRYADIQLLMRGREVIGYQDVSQLAHGEGYDAERDIEFLCEGEGAQLYMNEGDFAIFFPQDAHRPGMLAPGMDKGAYIDLAVFKIKL